MSSIRKSNLELPLLDELYQLMALESQRQTIRHDFLTIYPGIYTAYQKLAIEYEIDTSWVVSWRNKSFDEVALAIRVTTDQMSKVLLDGVPHEMYDALFDALAIGGEPVQADGIFVFGSSSDARIKRAVELYHDGIAQKLYLSGHKPYYSENQLPEAERMREYAIHAGVPHENIIYESNSIMLPDNVKTMLDDPNFMQAKPHRLVIVATTYILRRAQLEWYRFAPWNMEIIPISAHEDDVSEALRRDTWFQSERGVRQLLNEYAKITFEHCMDDERRLLS